MCLALDIDFGLDFELRQAQSNWLTFKLCVAILSCESFSL
jgi:hypothetical protein